MLLLKEDEYIISLLQGAVALINSCTIEMLRSIRNELSDAFVAYLKRLWVQAHKQSLCSSSLECGQNKDSFPSRIGKSNLAESIFKLSMNQCLYLEPTAADWFKEGIIDFGEISTEFFLSTIWELSPMLIRDASKSSRKQNDIFAPFVRYLGPEELIPTSLPSILNSFVSCPPIASDELDILRIINDVKNCLGSPIIYQQDIRVIKTNCSGKELHYFQEKSCFDCCTAAHNLHINEILKCEDAIRNGYSIALRGLEFRFQTLAAIADGLASFFGQPSVGINMYLTPPNSQGLARHSDDHCVFVCQLFGVKRWNIFPRATSRLPRLYETFDGSCGLEAEAEAGDKCQKILLKQGDILYIPRGFPHEAQTDLNDDESNEITGFSLHLTLAVEIEPPFEWEGFMHVALYSWAEKQKELPYTSNKFRSLHVVSVKLLHVVIKLLGNFDSTFRKACLVSSTSMMSSIPENWFSDNQKTIFNYLISRIATESKLSDAIQHVEAAIQKNEDPLEHVIWLKHLKVEGETEGSNDLGISSSDIDLLVHQDIAKASFMEVKSKFCSEVEFEDAEQHYRVLLDKYRKVRKQYTNGMLSLHSTVGDEHEIASL